MNPAALRRIALSPEFAAGSDREFLAPIVGFTPSSFAGTVRAAVVDDDGAHLPLIVEAGGTTKTCFDVPATLRLIREERYDGAELALPIPARLPFDYNRFPIPFIGLMHKMLAHPIDWKAVPDYPAYPLDHSADLLESASVDRTYAPPVRWPHGKKYAVALSHDIDTPAMLRDSAWIDAFSHAERKAGLRSAWFVTPQRCMGTGMPQTLKRLVADGHEIGAHGWRHDPLLPYRSAQRMERELRGAFGRLRELGAERIGYRSPWLSRSPLLYEMLCKTGFAYDSSAPTSDIQRNNARSNNGCGTVFPFQRGGICVLPVTLPLDSMRLALGYEPDEFWEYMTELIGMIRSWGGLVMIGTHQQPHHSGSGAMLAGYEKLLKNLAADPEAWHALPRDIAAHAAAQKRTA